MACRIVGASRWAGRGGRGAQKWLAALLVWALLARAAGRTFGDSVVSRWRAENGASTTLIPTLEDFLELVGERQEPESGSKSAALVEEHHEAEGRAEEASDRREHPEAPTTAATAAANNNKSKPIPQHYQVKSLLNVTHDYPLAYSQVICGYVWPMVAAITLFTNLMIVFVLTQRDMRTPTNAVLTAIAIADIIPILVPVPWFVYLFAMGNEKQVLYPPVACYFYQHSTRSVSEIFYFLSTWLNVLLACQDYLTACWPRLARRHCRIRVVVVEIVALTLLAFLLNLPQALKLVFKPVRFYYNGQLTWGCKALQARWFKDLVGEYVALYDDIFTTIIVVFVDGGPALVLITLTALLIRQLQRQKIQGHLLMEKARTVSKRRRERHRQQEVEASARVMIFVLLAFLAVKIPFATTYTLMIIQSRFEIHFVDNLVDFQKAITLTDLVFVLSYPINFTIFCCCSKKFRHKCVQLLAECNKSSRETRARLMRGLSAVSWGVGEEEGAKAGQNHHQQHWTKRHSAPAGDRLGRSRSWGRRQSLDEPAELVPPPPPPPIYYYLPHIVTTRYESIREQEPAEELDAEAGRHSSGASSLATQQELDQSLRSGAGQTPEGLAEAADARGPSVGRGCSDPGFLGIKHLALLGMVRRSSGPSPGARRARCAAEPAGDQHQRSLSLSHSKLSTLPSSTGALADIMLTTFLGAASCRPGDSSRSPASEPGRPRKQ